MRAFPIVIFDIDGTLADNSHRVHHVRNTPKNWAAYNATLHLDKPISQLIQLAECLRAQDYIILLVSGRGEEQRTVTEHWLIEHKVPNNHLYMRPARDYRQDTLIKQEILQQIKAEFPNNPIAFVVDDRQSVVEMWRREGLICLQCAVWEESALLHKPSTKALLTLMVGPSGAGKSTWLQSGTALALGIKREQVISSDALRAELTGDFKNQSKNDQVFAALKALAKTRIEHNLPTVIDATNIKRADRMAIINYINPTQLRYVVIDRPLDEKYKTAGWRSREHLGFDLIAKHHSTFHSQLKDILAGDNLPNVEVMDFREHLNG